MGRIKTKKFSPYSKPYPPNKPLERIVEHYNDKTFMVNDYETLDITDIQADKLYVEFHKDYDGYCKVELTFNNTKLIDNPHYQTQLKQYEIDLKNYKAELKLWNAENKKYLAEKAQQDKELRLKQFEKLKKEFENG